MARVWISLSFLAACAPSTEGPVEPEAPGRVLPEVWGPDTLEDHDPADDVVEVHLTANKTHTTWIDGTTTRVWTYNDSLPGPLIQAQVGDTVRVVLTNELDEPTTIHWHGLRIDNEMDGVPAVQDPVEAGEQFTYEFVVPDAGSYWYHPHIRSNVQVERGLQGPLVVHEEEPPAYDRERYFVLDDVLLDEEGGMSPFDPIQHMDQMHGRHGNVLLANGSAELLTDDIARGTRERWRVVNTANARFMYVDVTGADWRIVAIDGTLLPEPIDPGDTPWLLPVGRRLDLEVVPGDNAAAAKLRINLPNSFGGFEAYPMFSGSLVGDAPSPGFLDWDVPDLPEVLPVEQELTLALDVDASGFDLAWTINGEVWGEGTPLQVQGGVPTLLRIEEGSGQPHPFHLHGQFFQVLSRDSLSVEPGLQDTTAINGFETVELYTTFDNPGLWMAHCHILEHAELGMMTTIDVVE